MKTRPFLTLALMLAVFALYVKAQASTPKALPLKIGYTNIEYVIGFLPETKKIESEYQSFEKQLKNQLEAKIGEFQKKVQAFQQGHETMTEAVRNAKQVELQQLQGSLERLQLESQEKLASKHTSLLKPLYDKIEKAIKQVAKENGYTHVFSSDAGGIPILLYAADEYNISDKVLKKLGVIPNNAKGKQSKTPKS